MKKKVILDNKYAEVYFVFNYKMAVIKWKRFYSIPSENYKEVFISILDFTKNLEVVNYMADARLSGQVSPADRKWFQNYGIKRAEKNGLKHAAIIIKKDPFKKYYMNTILKFATRKASYDIKLFYNYDSALNWLLKFNDYK